MTQKAPGRGPWARKPRRRALVVGIALLVLVLAAGSAYVAWTFSDRVIVPRPYALMPEFEVIAAAGGTVTLPTPASDVQHANTRAVGTYGLLWEGGHALLGEITSDDGATVTRGLELVSGLAPAAGAPARLDNFVYRRDPLADLGLPFEDLNLPGEVGNLRAWFVPADGGTAVLLLHGRRRGELIETLRMIPALNELGLSVLALSYRNHSGSDPSPDGFYHYGASEWQDALTGARYLAQRGFDRVLLYGLSMGGAVALEALQRWPADLPEPVGLILDSPLIDAIATVRLGAERAGLPLPGLLTRLALSAARLRTGVDFAALRQAEDAQLIPVPVMLVAGTADTTIPIAAVDAFADRVRTPLSYYRLEGVEHVEAWNRDPTTYAARLRLFVASLEVRARATGP